MPLTENLPASRLLVTGTPFTRTLYCCLSGPGIPVSSQFPRIYFAQRSPSALPITRHRTDITVVKVVQLRPEVSELKYLVDSTDSANSRQCNKQISCPRTRRIRLRLEARPRRPWLTTPLLLWKRPKAPKPTQQNPSTKAIKP